MAICEVCGDDYDKALRISTSTGSRVHVFDSFECAMQALAPSCARCNCMILGHGVESDGVIYCTPTAPRRPESRRCGTAQTPKRSLPREPIAREEAGAPEGPRSSLRASTSSQIASPLPATRRRRRIEGLECTGVGSGSRTRAVSRRRPRFDNGGARRG
jgi:hypothetical protein